MSIARLVRLDQFPVLLPPRNSRACCYLWDTSPWRWEVIGTYEWGNPLPFYMRPMPDKLGGPHIIGRGLRCCYFCPPFRIRADGSTAFTVGGESIRSEAHWCLLDYNSVFPYYSMGPYYYKGPRCAISFPSPSSSHLSHLVCGDGPTIIKAGGP